MFSNVITEKMLRTRVIELRTRMYMNESTSAQNKIRQDYVTLNTTLFSFRHLLSPFCNLFLFFVVTFWSEPSYEID